MSVKYSVGLVERSLHARNQLDPSNHFNRTPTCDKQTQTKEGNGGKDLQKKEVLSREWKREGVMDDENGESIEPIGERPPEKT